jgi:phenylacetate-CoA ligase
MEVVDDQGRPLPEGSIGNLIGTNLHNQGMPLLRYKQGDRGSIVTKKCACGRNFRLLKSFEGRKNDAFILPSGEMLNSGYLLDLTYSVLLEYPSALRAFCLIQETKQNWTLELVKGNQWTSSLEQTIPQGLLEKLNRPQEAIVIQAKIVSQITKTKSGKSNPIISKLSQQEPKA